MSKAPFLLTILDGLALNPSTEANAVYHARTPTLDRLLSNYPNTTLASFGERVGLPEGQMGNSEVGHLNIGAGRVVMQVLSRINQAIASNSLAENQALRKLILAAKSPQTTLHIFGLVSNGGVHSSMEHIEALIAEAAKQGAQQIAIHAITDGRDRPQTASLEEVTSFSRRIRTLGQETQVDIQIASIVGRYYAMDRDKRWERTRLAYELYTQGKGEKADNLEKILQERIKKGETDEFLKPISFGNTSVKDGDVLLFANFRTDRMRQLVTAFLKGIPDTATPPSLQAVGTLTEYTPDFDVEVLFPPQTIEKHLGAVISEAGLCQLRLAETEKYAHVTYFFNGGVEKPLPGEKRILIPSPKDVATYDLKPEMSAFEVTEALLAELDRQESQVFIVNYANCDMVGHTGSFDAAVKAVETVDTCLEKVLKKLKEKSGKALITADHGNADQMIDYKTHKPHTFHTMHPVPLIYFAEDHIDFRSGGALCDIAPTMLKLMGIPQPQEMSGVALYE